MKQSKLDEEFRALKRATVLLRNLKREKKDAALTKIAGLLRTEAFALLEENKKDLKELQAGRPAAFIDRLTLTEARIELMAQSLLAVAALEDPVGEIVSQTTLPNGLRLRRVRAPLGVVLMVFESRPNVAIEAFSLAFKSGNAIALRGGSESKFTVGKLYTIMKTALKACGIADDVFYGFNDYDRSLIETLLKCKDLVDVVVPRGGENLIKFVDQNATMPIIKNDRGLCHAYVHEDADLEMAEAIVLNGKTSRPGVCNSLETVLVHEKVANAFLPKLYRAMTKFNVKWHACPRTVAILREHADVTLATDENFDTEYLDFEINSKVVASIEEALLHIERFGSKHSETVISRDSAIGKRFQNDVDAAAVYWNASTRFTDGFEFGLGGELGISTQKTHVRGPVGLRELTCPRWVIDGNGQVR